MRTFKNIMLVLLGILVAVAISCVIVGIGCAINGLTFGEQITQWFGAKTPAVEKVGAVLLS